jgi:hypothetical protein
MNAIASMVAWLALWFGVQGIVGQEGKEQVRAHLVELFTSQG